MRQGNFSVCNFRVPLLFPLEGNEAVVVEILQSRFQFEQGEIALAGQDIFHAVSIVPQILDVNMANRNVQSRGTVGGLFPRCNETVRRIPNHASFRRRHLLKNGRSLSRSCKITMILDPDLDSGRCDDFRQLPNGFGDPALRGNTVHSGLNRVTENSQARCP